MSNQDIYHGVDALTMLPMASGLTTGYRISDNVPVTKYSGYGMAVCMADIHNGTLNVSIIPSGVNGLGSPIATFDAMTTQGMNTVQVNIDDTATIICASGHLTGGQASYGVFFLGSKDVY